MLNRLPVLLQKISKNGYSRCLSSPTMNLSIKQRKIFKQEYQAIKQLIIRSYVGRQVPFLTVSRAFSENSKDEKQRQDGTDSPKKTDNTSSSQGSEDDGMNKKKKDSDDNEKSGDVINNIRLFILGVLGFVVFAVLMDNIMPTDAHENVQSSGLITWWTFKHNMLAKGEVQSIHIMPPQGKDEDDEVEALALIYLHPGAVVNGKMDVSQQYGYSRTVPYFMQIRDLKNFEENLREAERNLGISSGDQIPVMYSNRRPSDAIYTLFLLAVLGVIIYSSLKFKGAQAKSQSPFDIFGSMSKARFTMVDKSSAFGTGITFKDVAGLKEAKIEIMEFVDYLKRPEVFKELGAKVPRGALLTGPPGCGKTLLAKAVATEANVPFLATAGSEFVEMIGGLGASRVRSLFKEARQRAPCIIYIDEVDAIGRKRSQGRAAETQSNSEEEQTLNQLLVELDGMGTTEGVICLASTNREDILDKALMRPGRFDRHVRIDLPTLQERREIFEYSLKQLAMLKAADTYADRLAHLTPGFSGADIANVCNEAAIHAGSRGDKKVDSDNLEYAIEKVIGGSVKRSGVMSPQEKKVVAFHEAGHVLVSWLLEHTDPVLKVSIVPRTSSALGFSQHLPSDQKLYTSEELFDKMCALLGGRCAELVIFNACTTGAEDDLKKVTQIAYNKIRVYGMNKNIGNISFPDSDSQESGFTKKPYSKKLAATMDQEARQLVSKAFFFTENLILENKDNLTMLAHELLEKEVLNYDNIQKLLGPPKYDKSSRMHMQASPVLPDVPKNSAAETPIVSAAS